MKQFRGEVCVPNGNVGMRELVEVVQTQEMCNHHYLELKHLSDKNKYTSKFRKKKLGGKPFVIALCSRSLHRKKSNYGVKHWKNKRLWTCVKKFVKSNPSLESCLTIHPSILESTPQNAAENATSRLFWGKSKHFDAC